METLKDGGPLAALVVDHAINNYIAAISAAVQKEPTAAIPPGV
jgi:hypothetical protein